MKILLASETYPPDVNGAAAITQRLAQGLSRNGDAVGVLAPSVKFGDFEETDAAGFSIFRVRSIPVKPFHPYFRIVAKPEFSHTVARIVEKFQPDIIHIQNHLTVGRACLKVARSFDLPIIGTNHFMPDNVLQFAPPFVEKRVAELMWEDFRRVYEKLDFVTVPSRTAMEMVRAIGLNNRIEVISNGIDLERYKRRRVDGALYDRFGITPGVPTFITVGRLDRDKNVDAIIKALSLVTKKQPAQLIVVGLGKKEKELKRQVKSLGLSSSVIFTDRISDEDVALIYSAADCYVGAGSAELQGLAVMEAMAAGLPVLAANAVALPELIVEGRNGYMFDLDDNDLANKMLKILSGSELGRMGEQSLEIIRKHDFNNTLVRFRQLYGQIVEEKRHAVVG